MRAIKVFKFGGASVRDAAGFRNVADIIEKFSHEPLVIVVSAIGKTTNALEGVVRSYFKKEGQATTLLSKIKDDHAEIAVQLFKHPGLILEELHDLYVEIEWIIEEEPQESFDYYYDQIVSVGELLSSRILNAYLQECGLQSFWLDVRDVISTDNTYRDARIQWDLTQQKATSRISPVLEAGRLVVTQGFIGSTSENFTTTLGREGSDYTAAVISYCLDADSMHIWKDVPGVLTADPRKFAEVLKLPRLSYKEAIEMTYYGAKVIHPKTIKPIQNKNIPLFVRPFDDPESEGTMISDVLELSYPPVIVIEPDQCLLHISTNDFSFVAEHHLSMIFHLLSTLRIKVNMMRNTAISFTVCVQDIAERIDQLVKALGSEFNVVKDDQLELITIRHYNQDALDDLKRGKLVLFEERLSDTVQIVVRSLPRIIRTDA